MEPFNQPPHLEPLTRAPTTGHTRPASALMRLSLAAVLTGFLVGTAAAQPAATRNITINFEAVELPVFVKFISKVTGRNFVFTDTAAGTATIVSPTPVTPEEAYTVFQSVLSVRGLTTVDDGVVIRIVPIREARTQGAALSRSGDSNDGFATRLIPLEHVDVRELAESIKQLISKEGTVVAYRATNTLIVSDLALNTSRVATIVKALDTPSQEEAVEVIKLEHADAATTTKQLLESLQTDARGGKPAKGAAADGGLRIVSDERTNALIVTANIVNMRRVRDLVRTLDTPLNAGGERIHVYYARHADAEDLVEILSSIISAGRSKRPAAGKTDPKAASAASGGLGLSEDVTVSADPATNAVIIDAAPQGYQVALRLLEKLDIERPQVFVEAIIVEVSVDRSRELGFEFQGGGDLGDGVGLASSNLASLGALTTGVANPFALSGLILAAASDRTVTLPDGSEVPANVALFRALAADSDVNVLSAPTLLTLDNQEAEIVVGQNVPFITGQGVDLASVSNVFTTVERRDVGIRLKVTPQVSEGDSVILTVEEEVSAIVFNALIDAAAVGPTTTIRSASTTVSVADGRTAVIGGLISDAITVTESRVPVLSKIPILGRLFKADKKSSGKVNLIAFLTPHVIRSARDLQTITDDSQRKYQQNLGNTGQKNDKWEEPDPTRWLPANQGRAYGAIPSNLPEEPAVEWQHGTAVLEEEDPSGNENLEIIDDFRELF